MFNKPLITLLLCIPLTSLAAPDSTEGETTLYAAIHNHLIQSSLCANHRECNKIAPMYGRNEKTVELNLYSATDPKVVSAVFGFVAANGLQITKGKPVVLGAFPKPKEAYVNSISGFIANRKPIASLRLESP